MITYRGVGIWLKEGQTLDEGDYKVVRKDGLVFKAESVYGKSYGLTPDEAVEGAKKQIDQAGR
jgi:hypothetical protein